MNYHYINHRLLKYELKTFDYKKIRRRHYIIRNKNKLLLNYIWNITKNVNKTILFSRKISISKWYYLLEEIGIIPNILNNYNIKTISKDELWKIVNDNKCKECGNIIHPNKQFCSVKCANVYKSKNPEFIQKLSNSIKKMHSNLPISEKTKRINKISNTAKEYNSKLTTIERKMLHSNKIKRLTSFDNLKNRFSNVIFLFTKEFYYSNKYLPVKCKKCGFEWEMTKTTSISRHICTKCNPYKKHKTQTAIFDYINNIVQAKENDKDIISNEIDISVKSLHIGFEYDGLLPHSYGNSKISYYNKYNINNNYHLRKTEEMESVGYQLFHIFENEFLNKTKRKIWYSMINNKLGIHIDIPANNCKIIEVSTKESRIFLENNHLQGYANATLKYGLYYNKELVSLMTFLKHKNNKWRIVRFTDKNEFNITESGSKLLKHFEKNYNPNILLSCVNRRWSQGHLHNDLGFNFISNTNPNYFYFLPNENILYSRNKFQKHKLKNKLKLFDSNKTEIQNMFDNNYRIIYDCGNKKYIKYYN